MASFKIEISELFLERQPLMLPSCKLSLHGTSACKQTYRSAKTAILLIKKKLIVLDLGGKNKLEGRLIWIKKYLKSLFSFCL